MIELIFAIVVMGLILMSVPMIMRQSVQSTYASYQQEAIATLASHLQTIMGYEWDNENNQTVGYPVLQTSSSAIASCAAAYPVGVSDADGRYCLDSYGNHRSASTITDDNASDPYGPDDIDDFDGSVISVTLYGGESITTETGEYVDLNVSLATEVNYGDDTPRLANGSASTIARITTYSNPFNYKKSDTDTHNIKLVTIKLTTVNSAGELDKEIRLSSFMCNIGAPRRFYFKDY